MSVLDNKTILITGGSGSFGHHMASELLMHNPKEVRILSRHEDLQHSMRREFPGFTYIIGDVRDSERMLEAARGVDIVIHAAALKQVPDCEAHPVEAVKTNIIGAENVRMAAVERGAQRVVFISTDKAVKPINVMGMTKAIQERIFISSHKMTGTKFNGVRYGNVLGSRGSVVPYFVELARRGQKLPLTSAEMTRFMLTLKDAINLVLRALADGSDGEIFVRKSPAANMLDLAQVIADAYHTSVQEVGIRPGEKIHETLVSEDEMRRTKENDEHYVIHPFGTYNNHSPLREYTSQTTQILSRDEIKHLLAREGFLQS